MKISMWMILDKMQKYQPTHSITNGEARISGIRFISTEMPAEYDPQYVYLLTEHNSHPDMDVVILGNGPDVIRLYAPNASEIINDLMAVFHFYDTWEKDLWEAAARKSIQEIVDVATIMLENPILVADMDGNILAMSTAFLDADFSGHWAEGRDTRKIPLSVAASAICAPDGKPAVWTDTPEQYLTGGKMPSISAFLSANGERVAAFNLIAHNRPLSRSDVFLAKTVHHTMLSVTNVLNTSGNMRASSIMLGNLLSGAQLEAEIAPNLRLRCQSPWLLILIDSPKATLFTYKRNIVNRLLISGLPCIPLIYEDRVLILASEDKAAAVLKAILGEKEMDIYKVVLSLPFEDLSLIRVRYEQALFALNQAQDKPGLYRGEECALPYLLSLISKQTKSQGLIHPGLAKLKQHDEEKSSELYETLFQYLVNERSILLGAQSLHVHKNSFMYRLQKIRSIIDVNLDDPAVRHYLLLSYLLEKS